MIYDCVLCICSMLKVNFRRIITSAWQTPQNIICLFILQLNLLQTSEEDAQVRADLL